MSRRGFTRRDFLKVGGTSLAGAAVLGVAGCGGGGGGQGGQTSGGNGGKATLEWWDYFGSLEATDKAINEQIAKYEEQNPNVKINRTTIGFSNLKDKIIQAAATGNMPDIVIIDNPNHAGYAAQGALADITEFVQDWPGAEQYIEGPWRSTIYQDKNYGVPFESNATALFYNKDAFKEAGLSEPPANWEELRQYARELTTDSRSGFAFAANSTEEGTFTFLPFLWQAGGDIPTIGSEAGGPTVEALELWNTMINGDGSVSQAATGWGQADVYNQFVAGQTAMMINGPWQLAPLEEDNPDFNWGVAPWPENEESASILGGENFAFGAGGNVEAAWDVVSWMAKPENIKPILTTTGLPNRKDMLDSDPWASDPQQQVFLNMIEISRPRAYGAKYQQVSGKIQEMYTGVLTNGVKPQKAANTAGEAIRPLLPEGMRTG